MSRPRKGALDPSGSSAPFGEEGLRELEAWLAFVDGCPLEFTIQYPPRPQYFQERFQTEPQDDAFVASPPDLLYVHVPFCQAHCSYCLFHTEVRPSPERLADYVDGVLAELAMYPTLGERGVDALDIGGGTPFLLPQPDLRRLLAAVAPLVRTDTPTSRSIETTPQEVCASPDKLQVLRDHGFARISLGVQTLAAEPLRNARRIQDHSMVERAVALIRAAGFSRLSIDLIFGLPGQSPATWQSDVRAIVALDPDAVTTYDCLHRVEGQALTRPNPSLPTPRELGRLYDGSYALLRQSGFHAQYGSLNFSRHPGETGTSRYFERRLLCGEAYLGLGAHATSWHGERWRFNARRVDDYLDALHKNRSPSEWAYRLPVAERRAKYLLFSLNFGRLSADNYRVVFGQELEEALATELSLAVDKGWLRRSPAGYELAEGQFEHLYPLRSLFYSPEARQWLQAWG